ncbi:short-chain dehydrogenase/reductase SDR [Thalassoporum mexicanum PCC 7367]|uniref:SDR family NAD(P)-dependent oxidoreductase n=1 Tax=Thalassoporum mexicanum TaxID=3457544 RepID=UPI00029FFDE5|nr:SDR family NAD(P)-dependent oxidoreductase [Pseudanabaena sp. PCC 7367]AFY70803.1 short-chain dehydrogenase/reductase SDR [Pseudanabaena sp. PCC 7367]
MNEYLSNFKRDLQVAVIGASGGIGSAFVDHLVAETRVSQIYAFSRSPQSYRHPKVSSHAIDYATEKSIAAAAAQIPSPLDLVIVTTGLLHNERIQPEKSMRALTTEAFMAAFQVNTIGPALVAKHFLPKLSKKRNTVFAVLSARLSSISDNYLGGWYAYRASKAALNMVLKNAAIETTRRNKLAAIVGLHPGTVDTALSEPFQANVPDCKLFTPAYASACLLQVINQVTPADSGDLFAWDGSRIPF